MVRSLAMLAVVVAAVAAAGLLAPVSAADFKFALAFDEYKCFEDTCNATAGSQTFETTIKTDDAVDFIVKDETQTDAYATMEYNIVYYSDRVTFSEEGVITFGTKDTKDHQLFYKGYGPEGTSGRIIPLNGLLGGPVARTYTGQIYKGTGAYEGATGVISYTGIIRSYLPNTTRFVSIITDRNVTAAQLMAARQ